ncbi:Protein of unknown function, partial [Cotesia congregata]
ILCDKLLKASIVCDLLIVESSVVKCSPSVSGLTTYSVGKLSCGTTVTDSDLFTVEVKLVILETMFVKASITPPIIPVTRVLLFFSSELLFSDSSLESSEYSACKRSPRPKIFGAFPWIRTEPSLLPIIVLIPPLKRFSSFTLNVT